MKCHSDPALAPKELVERYGDKSGFYEKVGNIRAIISIRSPLSAALEDAKEVFIYLSIAAFFVFGGIYALICYFFGKISKRDSLLTAKTAELEELNKTLEERVASEIEKRVQKEELLIQQSKMASMGEMIGAIAHQWKQPLNALSIIASDVKYAYEYNELDADYIREFSAKSDEQIRYMAKTIDDFKNFFKPDKVKTVFDPVEAVNGALALLSSQLKNNNIELSTLLPPAKTLSVYGNKNELAQVILNIANNAKDALVANVNHDRYISVLLSQEGDKIRISIEDTVKAKMANEEKSALEIWKQALDNITPQVEVKSRRIGGATFQVPTEIRPDRKESISMKNLIIFARKRGGKTMADKLAAEIMDAYNNQGGAFKRKEDMHRMAEANRAFAHFRF